MSDFESEEMGWWYRVDALTNSATGHREGEQQGNYAQGHFAPFNIARLLVRPCGGLCGLSVLVVLMYVECD